MPKQLTHKEVEDLFLDLWYKESPETFDALYLDNIYGTQLISDFAAVYPKLYRSLLYKLEDYASDHKLILP